MSLLSWQQSSSGNEIFISRQNKLIKKWFLGTTISYWIVWLINNEIGRDIQNLHQTRWDSELRTCSELNSWNTVASRLVLVLPLNCQNKMFVSILSSGRLRRHDRMRESILHRNLRSYIQLRAKKNGNGIWSCINMIRRRFTPKKNINADAPLSKSKFPVKYEGVHWHYIVHKKIFYHPIDYNYSV